MQLTELTRELLDVRLRCSELGHRDAELGARDVVNADAVKEADGLWVLCVLAAHSDLQYQHQ
jgi:hypothetical protein